MFHWHASILRPPFRLVGAGRSDLSCLYSVRASQSTAFWNLCASCHTCALSCCIDGDCEHSLSLSLSVRAFRPSMLASHLLRLQLLPFSSKQTSRDLLASTRVSRMDTINDSKTPSSVKPLFADCYNHYRSKFLARPLLVVNPLVPVLNVSVSEAGWACSWSW